MKTPICDFVNKYEQSNSVRLHMPGHKGQAVLGIESRDITEIDGADVLTSASGIIAQSEQNASGLFGSKATFYSTEGSTLCIKTMLTIVSEGKEKPYFIAGRNAHKSFVHACAILDATVEWIYSSDHLCSCKIDDLYLEKALKNAKNKVDAVYITSPDYLGKSSDIKSISEICKKYDVPLLVDNAHGAYLKFLKDDTHPITLGASMCCDSAHKTLPCLTGGAYLHFGKDAKDEWINDARKIASVYSSTSPSYLILQSLDACNDYLDKHATKFEDCASRVDELKKSLTKLGFFVEEGERLKIVLNASKIGETGENIANTLRQRGIECEFCDREYIVFMFSPQNNEGDYARLKDALTSIEIKKEIEQSKFSVLPKTKTSIRKATFAKSERVKVKDAIGRTCATPTVSCPPAVPVVVSGEIIDEDCVKALIYYKVDEIDVIKE